MASNRDSFGTRTVGTTSKVVLSRIRSLNTSLSFKRSVANPYTLSNAQPRLAGSSKNAQVHRVRSITPPTPYPATFKKATFQWVKGDLLGRGSYAQVFLALNATTGELMAVKQVELPQTLSDRSDSRQLDIMRALKFEGNTLKDLDHANIVQYLGYEESPNYLSIFLEYVPGGTISSCLRNHGRFGEEVTKSFTGQILMGLEYLHSQGILHRDLKADNILVEPTGVCKISDFGISKKAEDISRARAFTGMKGTIFWMAPEILDSKGKGYDVKVDIWSVGCVVLEMWTGERPWSGEELVPVMLKLFQHKLPPPVPPDIVLSEAALDFRRQCFQKDPLDRPSAAELQGHPYLLLPPGWRFEPSDIQGPSYRRASSLASRKSRKSFKSTRQAKASTIYHDPILRMPTTINNSSAHSMLRLSMFDGLKRNSRHRSDYHERNLKKGPPVVFITPPGSPVREISHGAGNTSNTSINVSGNPEFQKLKGFRIINPDPDSDYYMDKTYVYNPPPLPDTNDKFPYSARLAPPSLHHIANISDYPYPIPEVSPLPKTSIQPTNFTGPSGHQGSPHYAEDEYSYENSRDPPFNYEDSDSDIDAGTSLWKKPPLDLSSNGPNKSNTSDQAMNSFLQEGRVASRTGVYTEQNLHRDRPFPEEVYYHLEEFFPHHDLDKVIEVGHGENRKGRVKKSIRMVAEEQINFTQTGSRRRTKLWDSHVEELRI